MACDIHCHVEVKIKGRWHHWNALSIGRNYILFGKMAGVRGADIEPVAEPRGIPDDATFLTKHDCLKWGEDGHSHSWLSAAEAKTVQEWLERGCPRWGPPVFGYLFGHYIYSHLDGENCGVKDSRLVFWFDN